ncbi:MAG: tetratricopeptide repeat protein [Hyphomicrobiales bacterium]|nr:tetratricopeptide repeat protein [Hyphomicrobiales bacterium]
MESPAARGWRRPVITGAVFALAVTLGVGLVHDLLRAQPATTPFVPVEAEGFVGSETCATCHAAETALWQESQHRHAMDHATKATVLGDFDDATFERGGVVSRFFQKDGGFFVETDGPDGELETFEIDYAFGIEPLQQYLIAFPDGRIQALSIAWDSRPEQDGGQRWFHLYPDEIIPHDDILHWTKLNQNWNFMCAECHSTGLRKNYDAESDTFQTGWAEISVGCEACHGAGASHTEWAEAEESWWPFDDRDSPGKGLVVDFDERTDVSWAPDPVTGHPKRSRPPSRLRKEVETCGLCHARRAGFAEDWVPGRSLSQTHAVRPIEMDLFHADGQMLDEVYNYASFKQSKMFAAGVTCSDCHDPHSAELKLAGDGVCLQCHVPSKYEAASHSHHEDVLPEVGCSACHMPVRTYMVVDPRHDHGFRVPRPDLTVSLGTPNACNDCHEDRSAEWASAAVEDWFGPQRTGFQTYAEAFTAAWNNRLGAAGLLAGVARDPDVPAIARTGALSQLATRLSAANIDLARTGLGDRDPMVRIGALDMIEGLNASQRWGLASPLLSDSIRAVRIRAASLLADVPAAELAPDDRARLEKATEEFLASHRFNADRPESRSALGTFYVQQGRMEEAEAEYLAALQLSEQFAPAAVNLADLYRALGANDRAEEVLLKGISVSPDDPGLHHALGLTLVRMDRSSEALAELQLAMELDETNDRYAYVYAVALHSTGDPAGAIDLLAKYVIEHPGNREILLALVAFNRDAGDIASALQYAEQLLELSPDDPQISRLVDELRRNLP